MMEIMQREKWQWVLMSVAMLLIMTACQPDSPMPTPTPPVSPTQLPTIMLQATGVASPETIATGDTLIYTPNNRINVLPVPSVVTIETLPFVIVNQAFEEGIHVQGSEMVTVPDGWIAWWREGAVDCTPWLALGIGNLCPAYLSDEPILYQQPVFSLITSTQPEFSGRVFDGGTTVRFSCANGLCSGGYLQRVQVIPGARYILSVWAQSWCANHFAQQSQLATETDRLNCLLSAGIDPTGDVDPLSPNIIWSNVHAYDQFSLIQTPPITATTRVMTIYVRGRNLLGFMRNDFYFDRVEFRQVE